MAENTRPKLYGKYLLNPYYHAIIKYYATADIRDLANLIREKDIPQPFKETIALILLGEVAHDKASKGSAKSYLMKRLYEKLIANALPFFFDSVKELVASGDLPQDRLDNLRPNYGKKEIIQHIANNFYNGNYESARRIIARKIKNEGWRSLPDF